MRPLLRPIGFALLCAIWGSTWLVIKVGYGGLGALNVAALRFLVAGAVLVPIALTLRTRWPRGREELTLVGIVGIVLFALDYGLIYWGEQSLDSGLTAILFAVNPLTTALAAHLYLAGERATPRKLAGTVLAFVGVVLIFGHSVRVDRSLALPMLAIVAAAACASIASVASKRHQGDLHPAALNAPAMLLGGALLLVASFATGESPRLPTERGTWGAIIYLALAGSVVTFLIYFWLLRTWSATSLSFIAVLAPLVALALGFVARGERLTLWTAAGAVLVLAGVAFAVTAPSRVPST